jgi:hypothetical protein
MKLMPRELRGRRRSYRDPKGTPAGATRSRTHAGTLSQPLHATIDAPESILDGRRGITTHGAEEDTKAAKKRRKQHHQEATTDNDSGINEQADGPSAVHTVEATGSGKHQARPPMDHFERLLREACPNHAYAVKYKL